MSLTLLRPNLVESSEGWTVRMPGRDSIEYVDGDRTAAVETEALVSNTPGRALRAIYPALTRWVHQQPPVAPDAPDRAVIMARVGDALDLMGVDVEWVEQ